MLYAKLTLRVQKFQLSITCAAGRATGNSWAAVPIVLLPICQQRCRRYELWVTWEVGGGDVKTAVNTAAVTPLTCNWLDIKTTPSLKLTISEIGIWDWQELKVSIFRNEQSLSGTSHRPSLGILRQVKEDMWHLLLLNYMSLSANISSIVFIAFKLRQLDSYDVFDMITRRDMGTWKQP